jgi:hypothetical protein
MKIKHQLELLYFQVDEGLVCMDIVSTFHIIIIIFYRSFNVKIFWKFRTTNQFRTYFSSIFLIILQTLCSTYNKLNEMFHDVKMKFK